MKARLLDIDPGCSAVVSGMDARGGIRRRMQDMGIVEGSRIECLMRSPLGDPTAYIIKGAVIALRREDAKTVTVETLS